MAIRNTLPFARGETLYNFDSAAISASGGAHLLGQVIHDVEDTVHGTGEPVTLVILRNKKGGRLRRYEGVFISPTALPGIALGHSGKVTGSFACYVDDAYATSIYNNDIFYAVVGGPVFAKTKKAATTYSAGQMQTVDNLGRLYPIPSSTAAVPYNRMAKIDRAVSNSVTSVTVLVHMLDKRIG